MVAGNKFTMRREHFGLTIFALKKDMDGAIDAATVINATDYIAAAIELVDSRTLPENRTIKDIIADNGSFGACLPQPIRKNLKSVDLNSEIVEIILNEKYQGTGKFIDVMNSPVNSIVWLAARLLEKGTYLKAGDIILSGSSITPFALHQGDKLELTYSSFGEVSFKII
jgi:2-keto-4-pentenoate hydratase